MDILTSNNGGQHVVTYADSALHFVITMRIHEFML